jgi:hypothetical protein
MQQHRLARFARIAVAAECHGIIELGVREIGMRTVDVVNAEFDERLPISNGDVDRPMAF